MRNRISILALGLVVCLLAIAPNSVAFDLVYDAYFEVPSLGAEPFKICQFVDIDDDGTGELLVVDAYLKLLLYSVSEERVIYEANLLDLLDQAGVDTDGIILWSGLKVAVADVNRDGFTDVVAGTCVRDSWHDTTGYYVFAFVDHLSPISTVTIDTIQIPPHTGVGVIEAADVNFDGYDELTISYDTAVWDNPDAPGEGAVGEAVTTCYYSYPDSVLFTHDRTLCRVLPPVMVNGTPCVVAGDSYHEWSWVPGEVIYSRNDRGLSIFDIANDRTVTSSMRQAKLCNGDESYVTFDRFMPHALGDFRADGGDPELLVSFHWSQACTYSEGGAGLGWDSSYTRLYLYEFDADMGPEEVWMCDINHWYNRKIACDPDFPGSFFTAGEDELTRHDGSSGHEAETLEYPLGDYRFWGDPYNDGKPRLVAYYPPHIVIYRLDQVTDVEQDDPNLPGSFALGKAYPNPFNPSVSFSLNLPESDDVKVEVFNMLGQRVTSLHDGGLPSGETVFTWNAEDHPSGMYLIRATTSEATKTTKAILLK